MLVMAFWSFRVFCCVYYDTHASFRYASSVWDALELAGMMRRSLSLQCACLPVCKFYAHPKQIEEWVDHLQSLDDAVSVAYFHMLKECRYRSERAKTQQLSSTK